MSEPADGAADPAEQPGAGGVRPPATDPMKGIRGIFAATLILETTLVAPACRVPERVWL